jgi:uncharacterized protein YkwD
MGNGAVDPVSTAHRRCRLPRGIPDRLDGRVRHRAVILAAAVAAVSAAVSTAAPAQGTAIPACPPTAAPPDAVLCLVNAARAARSVAPLRADTRLTGATQRFAAALGTSAPLTHRLEGGPSAQARIAASGYGGGRDKGFDFMEVLGRSFGAAATPEQRVQAWLGDDVIRRALLTRRFRDIGVGTRTSGDTTTYVVVVAVPLKATRTARASSNRASGSSRRSPNSSRSWATR